MVFAFLQAFLDDEGNDSLTMQNVLQITYYAYYATAVRQDRYDDMTSLTINR